MVTRRAFVAGTAGLVAATAFISSARAAMPQRSDASTVAGKAALQSYRSAVSEMKARSLANPIDPLGWSYQALIHGIIVGGPKANFINAVFGTLPPTDPRRVMADAVWATCPHHMIQFLPWHRIYVHFFERIARDASGDPDFALPYWDYSNGDGIMPVEFREAVDGTPLGNSLFNHARDPIVNGLFGTPTPLPPQDVKLDALEEPTFAPTAARQGFSNSLEGMPHDLVHGDIGGDGFFTSGGDMGGPPTAGRDPIFWMHHCNIDRLWQSWLKAGGETTASYAAETWYTQRWPFIDETGQVKRVSLQDLDAGASWTPYDRLEQVARDPITEAATRSIPLVVEPTPLPEAVTIPLRPLEPVPEGPGTRRIELNDISPPSNLTTTFDVFLVQGDREVLLGAFNFFGTVHEDMVMPLRLVFELPASLPADAPVSLAIRPRRPVVGLPPIIGSISLLIQ